MVYQVTTSLYGNLLKLVQGFNEYELSDHNRAPVSMDPQRIEVTRRLANGTRRRFFIADKRTFTVSWSALPQDSTQTIDGGVGAEELADLYYNSDNVGTVQLHIAKRDLSTEIVDVHIVSMTMAIARRMKDGHYYEMTMTFEEV